MHFGAFFLHMSIIFCTFAAVLTACKQIRKRIYITMKKFNEYKRLDLAKLSREVLAQWENEKLFEKSVTTREGHTPFLFFEGPPSANGKT